MNTAPLPTPRHDQQAGHWCRTSCLPLANTEHPARAARHHARDTLTHWAANPSTLDDATLIVSELVTNAHQHTLKGPADLCLLAHGDWLLISVRDTCPTLDAPESGTLIDAEHGRGLDIVRNLATVSGCSTTNTGKSVWALLITHDP
ncbi:ATP-binding protein [Streptomyces sp. t39]|nr:ATP-binding protein [Streptomyces sp. t39]